jgi:hypothetical protein
MTNRVGTGNNKENVSNFFMVFPLIHQVLDFERQAAYVSGRLRAAVKTWYIWKPVSKHIEQAFVDGIEMELVSNHQYKHLLTIYD